MSIPKEDGAILDEFKRHLAQSKLKLTRERRLIYDRVTRMKGHFDAESLYRVLHKENSGIARGTVFRTIPILLRSGVIQTSVGKGKGEFFEPADVKGHHDHILCVDCGKVIEFRDERIERLQEKVCERLGVKLVFHSHKLFVRCARCLAK